MKEKKLGTKIDSGLNFEIFVSTLRRKVSQKQNAGGKVAKYMNVDKHKSVMKAFITLQLGYCPLTSQFGYFPLM